MNCILIALITAAVACVLFAGSAPEQTAATDIPVGRDGPGPGGVWWLYVKMPPEPSQSK